MENLAEALQLSSPQQLLNASSAESQPQPGKRKVKVAVLVSGAGELALVLAQTTSLHRRGWFRCAHLAFLSVESPDLSNSRVTLLHCLKIEHYQCPYPQSCLWASSSLSEQQLRAPPGAVGAHASPTLCSLPLEARPCLLSSAVPGSRAVVPSWCCSSPTDPEWRSCGARPALGSPPG